MPALLGAELIGLPAPCRFSGSLRSTTGCDHWPRGQRMMLVLTSVELAFPVFAAHTTVKAATGAWNAIQRLRDAIDDDEPVDSDRVRAHLQPVLSGAGAGLREAVHLGTGTDGRRHWPNGPMAICIAAACRIQQDATWRIQETGARRTEEIRQMARLETGRESTNFVMARAADVVDHPRAGTHAMSRPRFRARVRTRLEQRLAFCDAETGLLETWRGPATSAMDDVVPPRFLMAPCPKKWGDLEPTSDEAVRFCQSCDHHVLDLTEATSEEIHELLLRHSGRVCAMVFARHDGRVMTSPCKQATSRRILGLLA